VIAAPLFVISNPDPTIAQCKAGVTGSFSALNARLAAKLDEWLTRIREELGAHDMMNPVQPAAPFAVNQIVHRTNTRVETATVFGGQSSILASTPIILRHPIRRR
jgi:nitronate monooxygenase